MITGLTQEDIEKIEFSSVIALGTQVEFFISLFLYDLTRFVIPISFESIMFWLNPLKGSSRYSVILLTDILIITSKKQK